MMSLTAYTNATFILSPGNSDLAMVEEIVRQVSVSDICIVQFNCEPPDHRRKC